MQCSAYQTSNSTTAHAIPSAKPAQGPHKPNASHVKAYTCVSSTARARPVPSDSMTQGTSARCALRIVSRVSLVRWASRWCARRVWTMRKG